MRLDAVIKVGGSLVASPSLNELCKTLERISKKYKCVIVPGGSEFADIVRKFDKKFHFSDKVSDRMAIFAIDQYGLLLSHLIDSYLLREIRMPKPFPKKCVIFLPSKYMFEKDPLPNSWDVTSDSIAAHTAQMFKANKLILVKDVDGIFSSDPKKNPKAGLIKRISPSQLLAWNKKTCVDKFLPKILLKNKFLCYVVNGEHPERIGEILKGKGTVCTEVF